MSAGWGGSEAGRAGATNSLKIASGFARQIMASPPNSAGGRRVLPIEIVEVSREPLELDTFHTPDGSVLRTLSPWIIHTPPEREEEDEDSNRNHKRARVPASSKAVLGLQEVSAGDAAAAECAVCLQDLVAEDKLRAIPCSHAFHQRCIFHWLEINHVCPLCRHALPTQQDDEDENWMQGSMPVPDEEA